MSIILVIDGSVMRDNKQKQLDTHGTHSARHSYSIVLEYRLGSNFSLLKPTVNGKFWMNSKTVFG